MWDKGSEKNELLLLFKQKNYPPFGGRAIYHINFLSLIIRKKISCFSSVGHGFQLKALLE